MKRVIGSITAVVLAATLGLNAGPAVAYAAASSSTITTPSGQVVKKLVGKTKGVQARKGTPQAPGGFSTLATCDGVGTTSCYLYNIGAQNNLSKNGVNANFTIGGHAGALTGSDYHTLAEIAVESADGQQIVEVGWTVDPVVNKTNGVGVTTPRPFVYHWVNGQQSCYNGCGFVPVSGATVTFGTTNLTPGATAKLGIWHDDVQAVWWISWDNVWQGYFPDSLWTGASSPVSFTRMNWVQLFGEIASPFSKPCSDFGLGITPSSTVTTGVSKISSATYNNADLSADSASVNLTTYTNPSSTAGNPYAGVYAPATTNVRSFYYGGPMWNAAKTGVGTKGAC